jgi:hypothetical protein
MWLFWLLIGFGLGYVWRAIRYEPPRLRRDRRCPICGAPF